MKSEEARGTSAHSLSHHRRGAPRFRVIPCAQRARTVAPTSHDELWRGAVQTRDPDAKGMTAAMMATAAAFWSRVCAAPLRKSLCCGAHGMTSGGSREPILARADEVIE